VNRIFVLDGLFVFCGTFDDAAPHAHQALQACFGLDGPVELRAESGGRFRQWRSARVAPNAPHELRGRGRRLALVYLDALHRHCPALAPDDAPAIAPLADPAPAVLERLWNARTTAEAQAAAAAALGLPDLGPDRRALDPRVRRVAELLEHACPQSVSVPHLAAVVALSPSRLGHLFAREVGVTIPRFRLWLRLKAAAAAIGSGASLTELAHASGFADSAHFTRTVRAMFGIRPSDLAARSEFIQASSPPRS
jgi:AraC-like DNA-binding protein